MEGTYEYELERAELLGIEPPDRVKWEEQNKARLEAQVEEEQTEIARELEGEDETIKGTQGKMDELNSILSATQLKINKFKTVCGSFTSLLKYRSGSPAPSEERRSSASNDNEGPSTSINTALDTLDKMQDIEQQSDAQFAKNEAIDISQKVTKNLGALDRLFARAESAEISLNNQNKQMKSLLRK